MSKETPHNEHHDPKPQKGQRPQNPPPQGYYGAPPEYGYQPIEEDEIDLIELAQTFWNERILIAKITGAFLVLGLLIALFSPKEYSTEATLMPESQSAQSGASGLLQQYGGMLGISGGQLGGQEGSIPPQLYPNIVQSLPYQVELMNTEVHFSRYDTTATVHDFFSEIHSPFSLVGFVKGYTIGLPGKIIGLFKREEEQDRPLPQKVDRNEVLSLSKKQMGTVNTLRERLSISVDQETGILTLTSEFPDPRAAAEVGKKGIQLLRENVEEYRTEKARQNLEFVQEQVQEAQKRFEEAQQRLAEFRDSNQNLATAKAQSREQELQSRYDLTFNLYNSLSQREEQVKLDLQEETPVLSVLQPVSVPLNDNTSGLLILIVTGLLGGIIALGWVLVENWWRQ